MRAWRALESAHWQREPWAPSAGSLSIAQASCQAGPRRLAVLTWFQRFLCRLEPRAAVTRLSRESPCVTGNSRAM